MTIEQLEAMREWIRAEISLQIRIEASDANHVLGGIDSENEAIYANNCYLIVQDLLINN